MSGRKTIRILRGSNVRLIWNHHFITGRHRFGWTSWSRACANKDLPSGLSPRWNRCHSAEAAASPSFGSSIRRENSFCAAKISAKRWGIRSCPAHSSPSIPSDRTSCFPDMVPVMPSACANGALRNWPNWGIPFRRFWRTITRERNCKICHSPSNRSLRPRNPSSVWPSQTHPLPAHLASKFMHLSEFNFPFDASLIATEPVLPREQARLLVLTPHDRSITHRRIADMPDLLTPGDLLVVNDTRVRPARVKGRKASGRFVDVLFVKAVTDRDWEVLLKGTWRAGQVIEVAPDARLTVLGREGGRTVVRIEGPLPVTEWFHAHGRMPLPPYIKRPPNDQDREWYQTVFAKEEGAMAVPMSGLPFISAFLTRLAMRRVEVAKVTLHVGVGTFKPV